MFFPVKLNPAFGENKKDLGYEYKYKAGSYIFNMPGDDIKTELSIIEAKKWVYARDIEVYSMTPRNEFGVGYVELWWRAYDGKYKIKFCKGTYDARGEIIAEEVTHYKSGTGYRREWLGDGEYIVPYKRVEMYTHRAAEYSFNL